MSDPFLPARCWKGRCLYRECKHSSDAVDLGEIIKILQIAVRHVVESTIHLRQLSWGYWWTNMPFLLATQGFWGSSNKLQVPERSHSKRDTQSRARHESTIFSPTIFCTMLRGVFQAPEEPLGVLPASGMSCHKQGRPEARNVERGYEGKEGAVVVHSHQLSCLDQHESRTLGRLVSSYSRRR